MPVHDRLSLKIEKEGLEAHVRLRPRRVAAPGGEEPVEAAMPSVAELEIMLREQGVLARIDAQALQSALKVAAFGAEADVVAARGVAPERGADGYVEWLVESADAPWAAVDADGTVDFKSTRLIRNVRAGEPLAFVHAPAAGKPGRDVFGRPLASRPGKPVEPRLGANTRRADHDPNLIVAATGGHFRMVEGVPEVQECFVVEGDVDYSSGNVTFGKSVLIEGDVKSGFSVEAGGDAEIWGLAEDCRIMARGKLLIKGGFTGAGKGAAQAHGEIRLGYVRNQEVRGESDVLVFGEAVNSRLQARRRVSVYGLLAGGKVQARQLVECQTAGTEKGAVTHIETGFDFSLADRIADVRAQMDKLDRHARKLEEGLRHAQDLERLHRGLERWVVELVFEMESMRAKVDAKLTQLSERHAALERQANVPADARITVRRKVFPGVVIKIGRETLRVDNPLAGPKTFRLRDGRIEVE